MLKGFAAGWPAAKCAVLFQETSPISQPGSTDLSLEALRKHRRKGTVERTSAMLHDTSLQRAGYRSNEKVCYVRAGKVYRRGNV